MRDLIGREVLSAAPGDLRSTEPVASMFILADVQSQTMAQGDADISTRSEREIWESTEVPAIFRSTVPVLGSMSVDDVYNAAEAMDLLLGRVLWRTAAMRAVHREIRVRSSAERLLRRLY